MLERPWIVPQKFIGSRKKNNLNGERYEDKDINLAVRGRSSWVK